MPLQKSWLMIVLLGFFSLPSAHSHQTPEPDHHKNMVVPASEVYPGQLGDLVDDGNEALMLKAIDRQLQAFQRRSLTGKLVMGGHSYDMEIMKETLVHFKAIFQDYLNCSQGQQVCRDQFNDRVQRDFRWYTPVTRSNPKAHFTGYYSPTFKAKEKARGDFRYGLYRKPQNSGDLAHTRNDILFRGALEGKGLELFYMNDPFELFLLHVEGGGVVQVDEPQGQKQYFLSYEGSNGQSFSFIGPYMRDQGYIPNASVEEQRKFLKANPDKWEEIYAQTPNFIFFRITKTEPLGMENIPLTPGRSMAQDRNIYWRKGILGFAQSRIPDFSRRNRRGATKKMSRFFIDQDTGGAIRGEARADLYWGYGDKAQFLAENLDSRGQLYFLVKK